MGELALMGTAFAFGIGSAILPIFLNAEVYVATMSQLAPQSQLVAIVLALCVGTVIGKAFVFELARQGRRVIRAKERKPARNAFIRRMRQFSDWLLTLLDRPVAGGLTVFVSSISGIPPLAVVTIIAGASNQNRWVFYLMVFVGRAAQFLAIAFVGAHAF
ncbi:hypothetical protein BH09ACT10_BH09ACT10_18030 [soil metagenome]